ncbi:MAG: tetratricopeptide repeat protein [Candidatus Abawacabacteria bacterium]|nr:tetratricopeptide repeat protein [Candidatus Abawacabacteria bacterium]
MSRILFFIGSACVVAGIAYGASQYWVTEPVVETPQATVSSVPASLDELPEVKPTVAVKAVSSTPTPVKRPPEKLVILAESSTPGKDSKDPYIKQGKNFISLAKFPEAQNAFKQADQNDPVALYYNGLMATYFGDRSQTENAFNAIKSLPNVDAKINANIQKITDTYALFDTYQDARSEFLATLLAKQLLVIGEVDLAIGKLEYVQNKVADYTDINTLLGAAYLIKGNYEKAVNILSKALPNDRPEVYYWLGVAHLYQQNFNKAIGAFQLSLNKGYRPTFKPHEKMGDAYLTMNNFEQAVTEYKTAFDSLEGSQYIDLYIRPVWILIDKLARPEEALLVANQAISRLPQNAMAHNLVGWAQLALGNFTEAKLALEKSISLDITLAATYLNLGNYYRSQNDLIQAKVNYEKAVSYDKQGSIARAARANLQSLVTQVPEGSTGAVFNPIP